MAHHTERLEHLERQVYKEEEEAEAKLMKEVEEFEKLLIAEFG